MEGEEQTEVKRCEGGEASEKYREGEFRMMIESAPACISLSLSFSHINDMRSILPEIQSICAIEPVQ